MRRRLTTFFLSLVLSAALCLPAMAEGTQDIQGHWAECPMLWAQKEGILTGTSPTTLAPDSPATRAMAATVLYRYAGSPTTEGTTAFADVPAAAYYADAVAWAVQTGLVKGRTETAFCPDNPITREEFTAILYRLLTDQHGVPAQVGEHNVTTLSDFADASAVQTYAQDAMAWAVGDLFLSGVSQADGTACLFPQKAITRGELVHLLRQYDALVEGNPAQLCLFSPEAVDSILLQQGTGPRAQITEPTEIQRFLERVNAFAYTVQENPRPTGGFYCSATIHQKDGTSGPLLLDSNGINHHYTVPAQEGEEFFPLAWLASFGLEG